MNERNPFSEEPTLAEGRLAEDVAETSAAAPPIQEQALKESTLELKTAETEASLLDGPTAAINDAVHVDGEAAPKDEAAVEPAMAPFTGEPVGECIADGTTSEIESPSPAVEECFAESTTEALASGEEIDAGAAPCATFVEKTLQGDEEASVLGDVETATAFESPEAVAAGPVEQSVGGGSVTDGEEAANFSISRCEALLAPASSEDLEGFARERAQWQTELNRLRRELERHRQLLVEVCQLRERLVKDVGQGGKELPAVAAVMNGIHSLLPPQGIAEASVPEPVGFKGERSATALPSARSLLRVASRSAGEIAELTQSAEEPTPAPPVREIALDGPAPTPPMADAGPEGEREIEAATAPNTLDGLQLDFFPESGAGSSPAPEDSTAAPPAELMTVQPPPARKRKARLTSEEKKPLPRIREARNQEGVGAELSAPIKWWNFAPLALLVGIVGSSFAWVSIETVRTAATATVLADALESRTLDSNQLESELSLPVDSAVARLDGRRDYLAARAWARLDAVHADQRLFAPREPQNQVVVRLLERAIERAPANLWYRLSLAKQLIGKSVNDGPDPWRVVQAMQSAEPLYWYVLGDYYRISGRTDEAVAAFAKVLRHRPAETRRLLTLLGEVRVELSKALAIVPPSPIAGLQAVQFLKEDEGRKEWRDHANRILTQMTANATNSLTEELAAEATLRQLLGQTDAAAAAWERVVAREPRRLDFRLQLARLRFQQQNFAASDQLAEKVVQADPAGSLGDEARLLRSKIELASAGGRGLAPTGN